MKTKITPISELNADDPNYADQLSAGYKQFIEKFERLEKKSNDLHEARTKGLIDHLHAKGIEAIIEKNHNLNRIMFSTPIDGTTVVGSEIEITVKHNANYENSQIQEMIMQYQNNLDPIGDELCNEFNITKKEGKPYVKAMVRLVNSELLNQEFDHTKLVHIFLVQPDGVYQANLDLTGSSIDFPNLTHQKIGIEPEKFSEPDYIESFREASKGQGNALIVRSPTVGLPHEMTSAAGIMDILVESAIKETEQARGRFDEEYLKKQLADLMKEYQTIKNNQ